jgi:hypothetical protein
MSDQVCKLGVCTILSVKGWAIDIDGMGYTDVIFNNLIFVLELFVDLFLEFGNLLFFLSNFMQELGLFMLTFH